MGPPGWESIPGLLKKFTNTGSVLRYFQEFSIVPNSAEFNDRRVLSTSEGQQSSFTPILSLSIQTLKIEN
jgi:hypothetical protein